MTRRKHHRSKRSHRNSGHRRAPWYSLKRSWGRALLIFICMIAILLITYSPLSLLPEWICPALLAILAAVGFFRVWKRWMKILFAGLAILFTVIECFAILHAINPMYFFMALVLLIGLSVLIVGYIIRLLLIFLDNTAKWAGIGMGGVGGARIGWWLSGKLLKKK